MTAFENYDIEGRNYCYFRQSPLYSFGFGLSYTNFVYSDLKIPAEAKMGDPIKFSVKVTNAGDRDGVEVLQFSLISELKLKLMKKILVFAFVTFMALCSCLAQQRDPAIRIKAEIDGLTNALGLSKDEVARITPIVTESQTKQIEAFTKVREGVTMDRKQMHEVITKMRAETDKKLKEVLTPDQGVKLDAHLKKQAETRAKKM